MAEAFAMSIEAGRLGYLACLGIQSNLAVATSPLTAFLDEEQKVWDNQ